MYCNSKLHVLVFLSTIFMLLKDTLFNFVILSFCSRHCKEDPIYVFQEMKLRGLVPNFHIHVSVSDLCISTICPPILLQFHFWNTCSNFRYSVFASAIAIPVNCMNLPEHLSTIISDFKEYNKSKS
jgi:hypothetical protein